MLNEMSNILNEMISIMGLQGALEALGDIQHISFYHE